ncbi:MAG: hypothetical protein E7091_04330 [Bacteroidales bacterium]|nr:hypothetical protein [Bacteroidales bacterium]
MISSLYIAGILMVTVSCETETMPVVGAIQTTETTETTISCSCPMPSQKVQDYGFYYGDSASDVDGNRSEKVAGTKNGTNFTAEITDLNSNTTYYIKAYAINKKGVGYSEVIRAKTEPCIPGADDNEYPELTE